MIIKDNYKITIVTVTYNSASTLEQTIVSVTRQDYPNIEYIIVDGASSDETVDIIKKHEDKFNIRWLSEPDKGIYDAFNKGIDMATGDYIQFLGSDDALYNADTISRMVAQLDDNTDILSGSIMVIDEMTRRQYPRYNHFAIDKEKYRGGMIPHPGMFVKASLMRKYKFDISYKIAADYRFFLQCYYDENVKFKFIDVPVVFFANSGSSSSLAECWEEDNRTYMELGLPFHAPCIDGTSAVTSIIRKILWKIGLLQPIIKVADSCRHYVKSHFVWERHTCDNPICRWCERERL